MVSLRKAQKKIFFFCYLDGTVVLCTALLLTSAFHVIRDITERKKSTLNEGSLWKNESGRQLVRKFQDNET